MKTVLQNRASLATLDEALFAVRRLAERRGYRARIVEALGHRVEISAIRVLRAVQRFEGPPPGVGEVATALDVDPSTASRLIDQQVAEGTLRRQRDAVDARRSRLKLTRAGHRILENVGVVRLRLLDEATQGWTDEEIRLLSSLLIRLRDGFDRFEDPQP